MSERKRNVNIFFRVTEQERDLIEQKMELAGIHSMGAYLRKMAIDGYTVQLDLTEIRELNTLLRSVSNNMNQIARRANETRSIYEVDVNDLRERYDRLWEKAENIIKNLAKL